MTTIAWDGRTMSADRQSTYGTTPTKTRKVFKAKHPDGREVIYACSGLTHECQEFTRWANGEINQPVFTDISVICVDRKLRVWQGNSAMQWARVKVKQWAAGSGADYALGAMAAGKTSAEAVRIASKLDVNTGFGVDTMSFEA